MRKRNVSFIADKLLWFIILILPLLFAIVFTCASMNNYQFDVSTSDDSLLLQNPTTYGNDTYYNTFLVINGDFKANLKCLSVNSVTHNSTFASVNFDLIVAEYENVFLTFYDILVNPDFVRYSLTLDDDDDMLALSLSDYSSSLSISVSSDTFVVNSLYEFTFSFHNFVVNYDIYRSLSDYYLSDEQPLDIDYYYNCSFGTFVSIPSNNIFNIYFNNLNYSLDSWFTFGSNDIIYTSFNSVFGSQSHILPIFVEGSFIPKYLTYMAWVYVLHVVFDLLVFIPRLAHKWMGGVYHDDE